MKCDHSRDRPCKNSKCNQHAFRVQPVSETNEKKHWPLVKDSVKKEFDLLLQVTSQQTPPQLEQIVLISQLNL